MEDALVASEFSSLEEGYGTVSLAEYTLSIASSGISWSTSGKAAGSCSMNDLLGASAENVKGTPSLLLTAYTRKKAAGARKRVEYRLVCSFIEQAASAAEAILNVLYGTESSRTQKRLVLINPFGGGGKAPVVWRRLQAILAPSGLPFEVVQTTHAGHAQEMMQSLNLAEYRCVCTVSGDGLVYEVINGLMARSEGKAALEQLPIAPVPGGTGNALWRSICHEAHEHADIVGAAFILAKGQPAPLDMWEYLRPATASGPEERIGWSMLSLSWGIIADVDLESEVLRFLGALRNTIYAIWRIVSLRKYGATLEYLDAETDQWVTVEANKCVRPPAREAFGTSARVRCPVPLDDCHLLTWW